MLKRFQKTHADCHTRVLEKDGLVMRFWNNDVLNNLAGVLEMILNTLYPPLHSGLSHKGRDKILNPLQSFRKEPL